MVLVAFVYTKDTWIWLVQSHIHLNISAKINFSALLVFAGGDTTPILAIVSIAFVWQKTFEYDWYDQLYISITPQKSIFSIIRFCWVETPHLLPQWSRLHLYVQKTREYDWYNHIYILIAQQKSIFQLFSILLSGDTTTPLTIVSIAFVCMKDIWIWLVQSTIHLNSSGKINFTA